MNFYLFKKPLSSLASFLLCVIIAILQWWMMFPGIKSMDSNFLYYTAVYHRYFDFRPVLSTVVLSTFFSIGGDMFWVTLAQILLGTIGIWKLSTLLLRFFSNTDEIRANLSSTFLLLLLFSPFTPTSVYHLTLWTDTWVAIGLIWALTCQFDILQNVSPVYSTENKYNVLGYLAAVSIVISVRYNSIVVYPFLTLLVYKILEQKKASKTLLTAVILVPICIYLVFLFCQNQILTVQRTRPQNAAYALDLASMIVTDPSICANTSIRSCRIVPGEFSPGFVVGNGAIDFTLNQSNPIGYLPFVKLFGSHSLPAEYAIAVREHPILLIYVKVLNYLDYIGPDSSRFFFQMQTPKDPQTPELDLQNPGSAEFWLTQVNLVINHPVLRWFSFVHAPWLIFNVLGLVVVGFSYRKSEKAALLFLALLVPFSYYFSYLIALTASEFRFLYPSMLLMQVIVLSAGIAYFSKVVVALSYRG